MQSTKINVYEFDKTVNKSIEDIEASDWNINDDDDGIIRYNKSISAYFLHNWYNAVSDITFKTYFYNSLDDIPEILPFAKSMVRYEHKSPADSEYWGPITTKKELEKMFYTSLTSRMKPGKIYCVREWIDLEIIEYRCVWNNYLTAISTDHEIDTDIEFLLTLIEYVKSIEHLIPFTKCIFDVGVLKDTNEFILIEFNSWETLSRPHYFHWIDHTEYLYSTTGMTSIKTNVNSSIIQIKYCNPCKQEIISNINACDIHVSEPIVPSGWLIHDNFLYVVNDVWLQKIKLDDMTCVGWKRGVFRFSPMQLSNNNTIIIGTYEYSLDLKLLKENLHNKSFSKQLLSNKYRYGFRGKFNDINIFCRVDNDCNFAIEYIE